MIKCKPMIATCEEMPEYNISINSWSDYITLVQGSGDEKSIIEIASAEQAYDVISVIRAAMALNGWDQPCPKT